MVRHTMTTRTEARSDGFRFCFEKDPVGLFIPVPEL